MFYKDLKKNTAVMNNESMYEPHFEKEQGEDIVLLINNMFCSYQLSHTHCLCMRGHS